MTQDSIDALAEAVARRVIEVLRAEQAAVADAPRLLTVAEVSQEFGLAEGWVYSHAEQLGVIRMGPGPRARLRLTERASTQRSCAWDVLAPLARLIVVP